MMRQFGVLRKRRESANYRIARRIFRTSQGTFSSPRASVLQMTRSCRAFRPDWLRDLGMLPIAGQALLTTPLAATVASQPQHAAGPLIPLRR